MGRRGGRDFLTRKKWLSDQQLYMYMSIHLCFCFYCFPSSSTSLPASGIFPRIPSYLEKRLDVMDNCVCMSIKFKPFSSTINNWTVRPLMTLGSSICPETYILVVYVQQLLSVHSGHHLHLPPLMDGALKAHSFQNKIINSFIHSSSHPHYHDHLGTSKLDNGIPHHQAATPIPPKLIHAAIRALI